MSTTILSHMPILIVLLSAYRSLTQSEWEPVGDARHDPTTGISVPVWRMRRWRNGQYEFRDCTAEEATEAEWDRATK